MIMPTFSTDFTPAVLDPSITFTRAGATATRINASGLVEVMAAGTPRFDYDPVALTCLGLLVEDMRINICPYSEAFNSWSLAGTTTVSADFDTAPDGNNIGAGNTLVRVGNFVNASVRRVQGHVLAGRQ